MDVPPEIRLRKLLYTNSLPSWGSNSQCLGTKDATGLAAHTPRSRVLAECLLGFMCCALVQHLLVQRISMLIVRRGPLPPSRMPLPLLWFSSPAN